jgi:maltose alpha-D-glucosyltransferase/alpha-amylase
MAEDLSLPGRMSVRVPMDWEAAAEQRRDPESLLSWFERLIRRRRECPELGWGACTLLDAGEPSVLAHRADWQGSTIIAVHNLAGRDVRCTLELEEEGALVDLFAHDELAIDGRVEIDLGRYGARWFRLRRPGQIIAP